MNITTLIPLILIGLTASFFEIYYQRLIKRGWKFLFKPRIDKVGWKDFKVGFVLSGQIKTLMTNYGRVSVTLGMGPYLIALKVEFSWPEKSQPELPLK